MFKHYYLQMFRLPLKKIEFVGHGSEIFVKVSFDINPAQHYTI